MVLIKPNAKAWDLLLLYAEFAYNKAPCKATGLSPFKLVYGIDPFSPNDLTPRPQDQKTYVDAAQRVKEIQKLHELVKARIEKTNVAYEAHANKHRRKIVFRPGDLVWIHLRKECFPSKRKNKLMPRVEGPFEVLERINDNAYKIDLPGDFEVSATFNVANWSPFYPDTSPPDLRVKSFQQGEDDGVLPSQGLHQGETGPTRPRTRSQTKNMANLWEEVEASTNGLTGQNMPGLVHLIS